MRRITLTGLHDPQLSEFDAIIDVRAPSEYSEDHIPGAINLAVLSDVERARVGTVYTRESRFLARRIGAALVARNAANHLEGALADKPAGFRPLVYCWRGGQRSGSFALILGQIGWQVGVLDGGWRSWRRLVVETLYQRPWPAPLLLLDGNTGTAKTEILHRAATLGAQVIDLEALAGHRGSLFGAIGPQPSQKAFESALGQAVARLDPSRPVLVEAESNRIGSVKLPPALWSAMQTAPRIVLEAPLEARADWLAQAYADLTTDRARLGARVMALARFHPRQTVADWMAMADSGQFTALAGALMRDHYDPRYARTRAREHPPAIVLSTDRLDNPTLDRLAAEVCSAMTMHLSIPDHK